MTGALRCYRALQAGLMTVASTWLVCSLWVAVPSNLAFGADPPEKLTAPRLFPDKTLAYFRIDDMRQLKSDFERSSFGKLANDPELKPLADEFYGALIRATEEMFGQIGMNLDEFLSIPSGEFSIALLPAPKMARRATRGNAEDNEGETEQPAINQPVVAIFIDAGEDVSGIKVMLERLDRAAEAESDHLQKEYDRLTLHNYQNREDADQQFAYFIDQGVFVAASSGKVVEDLALVWLGEAGARKTLADNDRFTAMMKRCVGTEGERPQISFFIDPMAMVRAMSPGDPGSMMMLAMLSPLGLDGFQAMGGSLIVAPADFDSIGHFHVLLSNPRQGVLGMLRPKAGSTVPEDFVPSNVATYATINWDLQSALLGLERLYNQFRGEDALNRDVFASASEQLGIDFRKDVVDYLEGRVTFLQGFVRPIATDSQSNVIALRLRNVKQFESQVFPKLIAWTSTQASAGTEQFGSIRAYTFRSNQRNFPSNSALPPRDRESCMALLDDYLVISDSSYMLRQIADAMADASHRLNQSLEFQLIHDRIKDHLLGKPASAITYARPEEQLQTFYELIRDPERRQGLMELDQARRSAGRPNRDQEPGDARQRAARVQLAQSNPMFQALNEALEKHELPPFSEIAKHLAPRGGFLVEEETGLHYTAFALRRE